MRHTDGGGQFAFESVPPGRYGVCVEWLAPPGPEMLAQHMPFTSIAVAADTITTAPDLFAVAPIAPRNFLESGTALPGEVTLAWEPVPGATSYHVTLQERVGAQAPSEVGPLLASGALASPEWVVELAGGKVHGVVVEAYDARGVEVGRLGTLLRTVP